MLTRRFLDIIASFSLIIILLPLFLVIIILIKITSPGPIIYKQKRYGQGGKIFIIWKFRTMFNNKESEEVVASKKDSRITVAGKILRPTHLDELPQLWNIFKGDMGFVGPRPKRPSNIKFLSEIDANYKKIFLVKPGLTGIVQISGREWMLSNIREALQQEILYAKNKNLWQDLKIIFLTIPVILKKKGI